MAIRAVWSVMGPFNSKDVTHGSALTARRLTEMMTRRHDMDFTEALDKAGSEFKDQMHKMRSIKRIESRV